VRRGRRVWEQVLLVALAVLLAVSVPGLFADEPVASTDTTFADGTDGGGEGSQDVSGDDHCPYGHRSDGTCRACPRRTYHRKDGACRPVAQTPGCPVAYAKVSSWPGVCVPIYCQDNPANPNLLEWRNLTTGDCIDKCTTSGFEWFSRYRACRPSSCPHGRYSNGNCRPAPTTTTVPARWSPATCSFTFTKGTPVSSVQLPTHNRAERYRLTGILPPDVVATSSAGGSFTLAGTPKAGGDWKATLEAIPSVGKPYSLACSFAVPAPPDPPQGLAADGDSRGVPGKRGQSVITWESVDGATEYTVRHRSTVKPAPWIVSDPMADLTLTLSDLDIDTLYLVQVRAGNAYDDPDDPNWSDTVYTYPTRTAANPGDKVGIIPVTGYRPDGSYDYVLCLNSPPPIPVRPPVLPPTTTTTALIGSDRNREITKGVDEWETVTGMVTVNKSGERNCSTTELTHYINSANMVDIVRVVPDDDIEDYCDDDRAGGCAYEYEGIISYTRITISDAARTARTPGISPLLSCSELFRIAMHEAGHAFGLYHPDVDGRSAVNEGIDKRCTLSVDDIQAIIKNYQSR